MAKQEFIMAAAFAIEEIQAYKSVTHACYFCYLKLSKQVIRHNALVPTGKGGKIVQKNTAAASRRKNLCFSARFCQTYSILA